jgi:hypothetical protein
MLLFHSLQPFALTSDERKLQIATAGHYIRVSNSPPSADSIRLFHFPCAELVSPLVAVAVLVLVLVLVLVAVACDPGYEPALLGSIKARKRILNDDHLGRIVFG